jgi:hypothetical protein
MPATQAPYSSHFGSAQQVADELLAAADHTATSLNGVTPRQARLRAAGVLSRTGNYVEANTVLRNIQASDPASGMALACAFADAGEAGEAEALARSVIKDRAGLPTRRTAVHSLYGAYAAADGIYDPETMRMHRQRIAAEAVSHRIDMPPWPSMVDGCLLWWPEPEYQRLIRQLPGLGEVIGTPWRGHTARVESELAATGTTVAHKSLVAADFVQFITFLEESGADPLAASTVAAFTKTAEDFRSPEPWPPRPRRPCWCRSGKRYQNCCAKQSATA